MKKNLLAKLLEQFGPVEYRGSVSFDKIQANGKPVAGSVGGYDASVRVLDELEGHRHVLSLEEHAPTGCASWETTLSSSISIPSGTVEFWAYPDSRFAHGILYALFQSPGSWNAFVGLFASNRGQWTAYNGAEARWKKLTVNTHDRWHHVALAFDGPGNSFVARVDEEEVFTGSCGGIPTFSRFYVLGHGSLHCGGAVDAIGYSWDPDYTTRDNCKPRSLFRSLFAKFKARS